jgi:glycosyltransferase involved in cell wall biosynthesis
MPQPFLTVITCTYNNGEFLPQCLASVRRQTYRNFEHIFIDGASSDTTIDILKAYCSSEFIYSEKDSGLYEALNKGLTKAKGKVIGFLHADDILADEDALKRVAEAFENYPEIDFYCSKMLVGDKNLKDFFAVLGASPHHQTFKEKLYSSNYYAHPTYYCRREIIDKVGPYNTAYKIASDIDWLIRLEKKSNNFYFDQKPLLKFRSGGRSSRHYLIALIEEFQVRLKNDGFSFNLLILYVYHFCRRSLRWFLGFLGFNFLVYKIRKILLKIS